MVLAVLTLLAAALLEVGGNALIRAGLRGEATLLVVAGFLVLGSYGVVVNRLTWDFARLFGVYVAVFALTSTLFGRFVFGERLSTTTAVGLAMILVGAVVLQLGE